MHIYKYIFGIVDFLFDWSFVPNLSTIFAFVVVVKTTKILFINFKLLKISFN